MNNIKHSFIGHQGRCFDVRYSENGKNILSASEDGSAKLWDVNNRKCLFTFDHDKNNEVLRAAFLDETGTRICTCGSDGNAKIWLSDPSSEESVSTNASFTNVVTLPHGDTQIYACETLACVASEHVMTAAENLLHLWDLSEGGRDRPLKSLGFELYNNAKNSSDGDENTFGGRNRNPDRLAYVFDAKPSLDQGSMLVAVALSDGTIRLLDLRCHDAATCFSGLPSDGRSNVHSTSVCWCPNGTSLVAALGNGDISILDIRSGIKRACIKGAHERSCFGAVFQRGPKHSDASNLFATWSSDGAVRTWDISALDGIILNPEELCRTNVTISDYPIYSAATSPHTGSDELLIGGGGNPTFLGTLMHSISVFI